MSYELHRNNEVRLKQIYDDFRTHREKLDRIFGLFSIHFIMLFEQSLSSYDFNEMPNNSIVIRGVSNVDYSDFVGGLNYEKIPRYIEIRHIPNKRMFRLFIDPSDTTRLYLFGYTHYNPKEGKTNKETICNFELKVSNSALLSTQIIFSLVEFLSGIVEDIPPQFNPSTHSKIH